MKERRTIRNSKVKNRDIETIRRMFDDEHSASFVSTEMNLNRHTVNRFYNEFRKELIKKEQDLLQQKCGYSKIECSNFDYDINEIDKIHPPPGAYINIYILILNRMLFATVHYDAGNIPNQPLLVRKYKYNPRPYKWTPFRRRLNQKTNIYYMFRTGGGAYSKKSCMELLIFFIDKFISVKKSHYGISSKRLYYYIKEIEYRINHSDAREKILNNRLEGSYFHYGSKYI